MHTLRTVSSLLFWMLLIVGSVTAVFVAVFTFLLSTFPAGLVIYWTWNNLLSIAQQWVIMRRMGVKT